MIFFIILKNFLIKNIEPLFICLNDLVGSEKNSNFLQKISHVFIHEKDQEEIKKFNDARSLTFVSNFEKGAREKIFLRCLSLINFVKIKLVYTKSLYFDIIVDMIEKYFKIQLNCYEDFIHGLNLFEIFLSQIENGINQEQSSILLMYLNKQLFKVSEEIQKRLLKIFMIIIYKTPFEELKYSSVKDSIAALKERNILHEFISPTISGKIHLLYLI